MLFVGRTPSAGEQAALSAGGACVRKVRLSASLCYKWPMPRFEACLLDYGNTIVEFDRRQIASIIEALAAGFGRLLEPIAAEKLEMAMARVSMRPHLGEPPTYREPPPLEQMALLLDEAYGEPRRVVPELLEECNHLLQELFVASLAIEPEATEFLAAWSERLRLGLVSNYTCGPTIRRSLERLSIAAYLDPVIVSGDVGFVKPHARPFEAALEELGMPPEKVLFVGDRWDADMLGARDAGMRTCHHLGFTSDRELEERYRRYRPDFTIHRLSDLDRILSGRS
jgi:HAD superfamily hydrolase (TIGR01549 family)